MLQIVSTSKVIRQLPTSKHFGDSVEEKQEETSSRTFAFSRGWGSASLQYKIKKDSFPLWIMQSRSLSIALNNFCFAFLTLVWTPIKSRLLHTQSLHALAWIRWTYCEHQPTHTFKNIVTKNYCYTPTHRHTHALLINLPVKFIYQLCSLYVSRSSAGRESRTKIRWVAVLKTATPSRLHINSPGGFIQRLRCLFLGLGPSVGPAPPPTITNSWSVITQRRHDSRASA